MSIWGLIVGEGALNYQINQLRKALGDEPNNPQYIKTFPKLGFRFIAHATPLSEIEEPGADVSASREEVGDGTVESHNGDAKKAAASVRLHRRFKASLVGHELYVLGARNLFWLFWHRSAC